MTMVRKLICAWMPALVGSLLLPIVSVAAVPGTTYSRVPTTTTTPASIAEHASVARADWSGSVGLPIMTSGSARSLLVLSRGLVAPRSETALTGPFKGRYTKGLSAGTLDDVSARRWYHQQLDAIPGRIDRTQSLRNQARQAFELRNQARIDARALMSNRAKALGYDVTDPVRTWQQQIKYAVEVRGKQGSEIWDYILESSTRSRPGVDAAAGLAR